MLPIILAFHNIMRWVVLYLLIAAFMRALLGWIRKRDWTEVDRKIGSFSAISVDIQIVLGLLLYFVFSQITRSALQNFSAAMKVGDARFFALEHVVFMFLAVVFAHLGSILPRKATQAPSKHKHAALWFGLALLMVVLGMPWMRPLFPGIE